MSEGQECLLVSCQVLNVKCRVSMLQSLHFPPFSLFCFALFSGITIDLCLIDTRTLFFNAYSHYLVLRIVMMMLKTMTMIITAMK